MLMDYFSTYFNKLLNTAYENSLPRPLFNPHPLSKSILQHVHPSANSLLNLSF